MTTLNLNLTNRKGVSALIAAAIDANRDGDLATAMTHLVAAAEAAEADQLGSLAREIRAVIAKWSSR